MGRRGVQRLGAWLPPVVVLTILGFGLDVLPVLPLAVPGQEDVLDDEAPDDLCDLSSPGLLTPPRRREPLPDARICEASMTLEGALKARRPRWQFAPEPHSLPSDRPIQLCRLLL